MAKRKKNNTSDTLRSHLVLLATVTLLTVLVVMLGRRQIPHDALRLPVQTALDLRRPVPLSIGDQSNSITPIPLPGHDHGRSAADSKFVPLSPPVEESSPAELAVTPTAGVAPFPMDRVPSAELRWHRVIEGESLETIAQRYFGQADRAKEIFDLNRDILSQPDLLPLGVHLRLPPP